MENSFDSIATQADKPVSGEVESYDEWVKRKAAEAPPLSEHQASLLIGLFSGSSAPYVATSTKAAETVAIAPSAHEQKVDSELEALAAQISGVFSSLTPAEKTQLSRLLAPVG